MTQHHDIEIDEWLRLTPKERAKRCAEESAKRPRPNLQPGDKVTTDYEPKLRKLVRTVARVYPSETRSQTGGLVATEDGLCGLDSASFKKEPPTLF